MADFHIVFAGRHPKIILTVSVFQLLLRNGLSSSEGNKDDYGCYKYIQRIFLIESSFSFIEKVSSCTRLGEIYHSRPVSAASLDLWITIRETSALPDDGVDHATAKAEPFHSYSPDVRNNPRRLTPFNEVTGSQTAMPFALSFYASLWTFLVSC